MQDLRRAGGYIGTLAHVQELFSEMGFGRVYPEAGVYSEVGVYSVLHGIYTLHMYLYSQVLDWSHANKSSFEVANTAATSNCYRAYLMGRPLAQQNKAVCHQLQLTSLIPIVNK